MEYSDVWLRLKMQAESSEIEKTRPAFPFNQYLFDSAGNSTNITSSKAGGSGPFFWNTSSIQACGADEIYAGHTAGGRGGVAGYEESSFTASQLNELERQQIINKYMMASIPVPHELMAPTSTSSSAKSKTSGSAPDPRFSSSKLDPEPWRCRRTDGKKWRCSRNAAADQRYCDRHSHKNKPRSRKHVEAKNSTLSLQAPPTSQLPVMAPGLGAAPYDQARRIEWCTRGGSSGTANIPVSTCNYRQQMQQISSRLDLIMNTDNTLLQKNVSQSQTLDKQDFRTPFLSRFESKMTSFEDSLSLINSNRTHTTPPFIDAWEQEGMKGLSPSSLTLSMSSTNRNDEGNENHHPFAVGINDSERPGGPLGEALCLGNASYSNLLSPNDYTYTSNSSEDGSHHAFKFIS